MSPTHWRTKLQKTVMLSTAEAAASTAMVEITYLRLPLLAPQGYGFLPDGCMPVYEHSNVCIEWSNTIISG